MNCVIIQDVHYMYHLIFTFLALFASLFITWYYIVPAVRNSLPSTVKMNLPIHFLNNKIRILQTRSQQPKQGLLTNAPVPNHDDNSEDGLEKNKFLHLASAFLSSVTGGLKDAENSSISNKSKQANIDTNHHEVSSPLGQGHGDSTSKMEIFQVEAVDDLVCRLDYEVEDAMYCFRYLLVYIAALESFAHGIK